MKRYVFAKTPERKLEAKPDKPDFSRGQVETAEGVEIRVGAVWPDEDHDSLLVVLEPDQHRIGGATLEDSAYLQMEEALLRRREFRKALRAGQKPTVSHDFAFKAPTELLPVLPAGVPAYIGPKDPPRKEATPKPYDREKLQRVIASGVYAGSVPCPMPREVTPRPDTLQQKKAPVYAVRVGLEGDDYNVVASVSYADGRQDSESRRLCGADEFQGYCEGDIDRIGNELKAILAARADSLPAARHPANKLVAA